jgi:MFS transporter, SP family, sugar:H+ symporter
VEELDTMYLLRVDPKKSSKWVAPPPEELVTTEQLVRGESGPTGADVERNGSTKTPETAPNPSATHTE